MPEQYLIEALATGGPVAVLAAFIFIMYVKDRKYSEECLRKDRVFMEDRLTRILELDQKTREEHTKVLTELNTVLTRMNREK